VLVAPRFGDDAVVNFVTVGLAVAGEIGLASALVCPWSSVVADCIGMAGMLLIGIGAWVDRLTLLTGAGKAFLTLAQPGTRTIRGANGVDVAATVFAGLTLVDRCALGATSRVACHASA